MTKVPLGKLEQVDLREYWAHEASEFTPWLAQPESLLLLGDTLGIDLELQGTERSVGPFAADIVCRDTNSDGIVLIENQLEPTDHRHLGQILTYAAGLDAKKVIWIAREFSEEHRAAIDWLNRVTHDDFEAFAVVVELWRIGGSAPAPRFLIVAKPNDWTKAVRARVEADGLSEARQLYFEYWSAFLAHLREKGSKVHRGSPSSRHWQSFAIGRTGFHSSAVASTQGGWVAAEFVIRSKDPRGHFRALERERAQIDKELGFVVAWIAKEEREYCKLRCEIAADLENRADWPRLHEWTRERLEAFDRVLRGRVARLEPLAPSSDGDRSADGL